MKGYSFRKKEKQPKPIAGESCSKDVRRLENPVPGLLRCSLGMLLSPGLPMPKERDDLDAERN